ncbi:hypothetical protein [Candidatus Amarobacter glycogenicus]|uniref:hypothetical protein n=1 Tax=Candidatus Amarobacter glycogenicus TaxID=3140699 RepID=UPI0031CC9EC5
MRLVPRPLGVLALAFLSIAVSLALVLPVGVLIYWLINGLRANADFPALAPAVRHSVEMALAGAAITVALAFPVAILSARYGGLLARAAEQAATSPMPSPVSLSRLRSSSSASAMPPASTRPSGCSCLPT